MLQNVGCQPLLLLPSPLCPLPPTPLLVPPLASGLLCCSPGPGTPVCGVSTRVTVPSSQRSRYPPGTRVLLLFTVMAGWAELSAPPQRGVIRSTPHKKSRPSGLEFESWFNTYGVTLGMLLNVIESVSSLEQ